MRVYCLNALFNLIRAYVKIAEGVGAVPVSRLCLDHLDVLGNGQVNAPLFYCLFRVFQRGFTIERRHGDCSQTMLSNRVAGLNVRRCCCE